jgi:branched-chain amino acid transport system substrate-binding protein
MNHSRPSNTDAAARHPARAIVAMAIVAISGGLGIASLAAVVNTRGPAASSNSPGPSAAGVAAPGGADSSPGAGTSAGPAPSGSPIIVGAVYPLSGDAAPLAAAELRGVQIAAALANAGGGVSGRPIRLDVRNVSAASDAGPVLASLREVGAQVVIGTYSSQLSIPVSAEADAQGLVYWESGAVADQLTGRGLPLVFRVGASGSNLGTNSADFAAGELAPLLDRTPRTLRVAIVYADDDYASSVAGAAQRTLRAADVPVVASLTYNPGAPQWTEVMKHLAASRPDVIILASHIPDGIAFRRQMLKAGVTAGALIGTTMAECVPDFAGPLGQAAVGIFGSDRPAGGFDPASLAPDARALYDAFLASWDAGEGSDTQGTWPVPSGAQPAPVPSASPEGAYGGDAWNTPTDGGDWTGTDGNSALEEGLAGFTAGWALFHDVLPFAAADGVDGASGFNAAGVADAARALDLPSGSLPNGAGLRFSSDPDTLGQNERAIGMIWQWQAPDTDVVVWPESFATGSIAFVPLP